MSIYTDPEAAPAPGDDSSTSTVADIRGRTTSFRPPSVDGAR